MGESGEVIVQVTRRMPRPGLIISLYKFGNKANYHIWHIIGRLPSYEIWSLSLIYRHPCSMETNEAYDTKCRRAILNHFLEVGDSGNIAHSIRLTVTTKCIFYCNYSSRFCFTHVYFSYCDTSSFVAQQLRDQLIIRGSHNRASS